MVEIAGPTGKTGTVLVSHMFQCPPPPKRVAKDIRLASFCLETEFPLGCL